MIGAPSRIPRVADAAEVGTATPANDILNHNTDQVFLARTLDPSRTKEALT
jgi:hypothetical protein